MLALTASKFAGLWSGARRLSFLSLRIVKAVSLLGSVNSSPPCTIRWPTFLMSFGPSISFFFFNCLSAFLRARFGFFTIVSMCPL